MLLPRRSFILSAAGLAACSTVSAPARLSAGARDRGLGYPFTLGVASGDPLPDSVVLWTRLAPEPLRADGGMSGAMPVEWQIAEDERFAKIVQRGQVTARPEWGHSVHVEVGGLSPARVYHYRFIAGGAVSPIGRTRTAPAFLAPTDRLRFAFASCQHFDQGYFNAYDDALEKDPDFILHMGDYIYEGAWGPQVRRQAVYEAVSLSDYRTLHAQYKLDASLQRAHAAVPWMMIWDDHEVVNDYANLHDENFMPEAQMRARRAAAYQAYYEHMPVRLRSRPKGADMHFHGFSQWGNLASFTLTDARQYRDNQACGTPEDGGGQVVTCAELNDPKRSMFGQMQERDIMRAIGRSGAEWEFFAQPTLFSRLNQKTRDGRWGSWSDGWDGYAPTRQRVLDTVARRRVKNFVSLGGDMHSWWQADLKLDYADMASQTVGTEFVTTSITSHSYAYSRFTRMLPDNPHIKFFDDRERGYAMAEVTPERLSIEFREMETIYTPSSPVRVRKRYIVESGQAGAQES